LGHNITGPMPALCPVKLSAPTGRDCASGWKELQGISLENVKLNVVQNGKKCFSEQGDIVFTHFGLSGPAVLNISGRVGELLNKGGVEINIDLFPALKHDEVVTELEDILKRYANRTVKNILCFLVPERLAEFLSDFAGVKQVKIAGNMSKAERIAVARVLKNLEVAVDGLLGFEQAWVTRGGVSLKEIDHKTMKSKIIDNLFFAGEIIDVDGKSGGFNLQSCWSTGYLAGKSTAE